MCEASNKRNVDLDPMSLAESELRSFLDMPVWMDDESESEIPVFSAPKRQDMPVWIVWSMN